MRANVAFAIIAALLLLVMLAVALVLLFQP